MSARRKIFAVTGARSEYDILFPVLKHLHQDPTVELGLIVTGSHLSEKYGSTVRFIEKDGFPIVKKIPSLVDADGKLDRIVSLGNQILPMAQCFNAEKPDILLVTGDREECISTSMTGAYLSIPVAHIAGGDIAKDGNIDNSVRYATSKFAHIHFTLLEKHSQTLLKLGEDAWRIFHCGNPALDRFLEIPVLSKTELETALGFSLQKKFAILIQHPIISDVEQESHHIRETLEAFLDLKMQTILNYPNSDAGNFSIIRAYDEYSAKYPNQFFVSKNLERTAYVNLLRQATLLAGNSSSGIIEAPSLGLPVVNIGQRQRGRVHSTNVMFVDNDRKQILHALEKSTKDEDYRRTVKSCVNPYGDGKSGSKIATILANIEITNDLIYKNITY